MEVPATASRQPKRVPVPTAGEDESQQSTEPQPRDALGRWTKVVEGRASDTSPSVLGESRAGSRGNSRANSRAPSRASSTRSVRSRTPIIRSHSTTPAGTPVVPAGVKMFRMHEHDENRDDQASGVEAIPIPPFVGYTAAGNDNAAINELIDRVAKLVPDPPVAASSAESAKNEPERTKASTDLGNFLQFCQITVRFSENLFEIPKKCGR